MMFINNNLPYPEYLINAAILFIPLFIILIVLHIKKAISAHSINWKKEFVFFSFIYYIYRLSDMTIFPIFWYKNREALLPYGQVPFFETDPFSVLREINIYSLYNILGNIILFFPMGFYIGLLIKNITIKRIFILIFTISLMIESFQLVMCYFYFGDRLFDVMDIILNCAGGLTGYLIYCSPVGTWVSKYLINDGFCQS